MKKNAKRNAPPQDQIQIEPPVSEPEQVAAPVAAEPTFASPVEKIAWLREQLKAADASTQDLAGRLSRLVSTTQALAESEMAFRSTTLAAQKRCGEAVREAAELKRRLKNDTEWAYKRGLAESAERIDDLKRDLRNLHSGSTENESATIKDLRKRLMKRGEEMKEAEAEVGRYMQKLGAMAQDNRETASALLNAQRALYGVGLDSTIVGLLHEQDTPRDQYVLRAIIEARRSLTVLGMIPVESGVATDPIGDHMMDQEDIEANRVVQEAPEVQAAAGAGCAGLPLKASA